MESKDYVIAGALDEIAQIGQGDGSETTTSGGLYLHMKRLENVFNKVWEAGKREGYAEKVISTTREER